MKKFNNAIAYLLLTAISYYVLPKEFIHEIFHKHEGKDNISFSADATTSVSNEHNHCILFQLETPPAEESRKIFVPFIYSNSDFVFSVPEAKEGFSFSIFNFLRGPPSGILEV